MSMSLWVYFSYCICTMCYLLFVIYILSYSLVSGTSAACPVMAGMISLVNSARRANGNSTLGWLNPALYALHPAFVNDITSGDNRCVAAGEQCCQQGFFAAKGWDPVTGLGSLDFEKFKTAMMGIVNGAAVENTQSRKSMYICIYVYMYMYI